MDINMTVWLESRKKNPLRVGILGGTFDPVHNGHIELAKQAMRACLLDGIFLMPNHLPAYKEPAGKVSDVDRMKMVRLAVQNEPGLGWSDVEIRRGGVTYTADTLKQLHAAYPYASWYFVMGGDSILQFDTWRTPDVILQLATLVVTTRKQGTPKGDISENDVAAKLDRLKQKYPGCHMIQIHLPELPISSTEIRKLLAAGTVPADLLPTGTLEYIKAHGQYQIGNERKG